MELTLDTARVGDEVKIIGLKSKDRDQMYLISLGILPGDQIKIIGRSPFGGPISCKHQDNTFFALRKEYASKVKVKKII